MSRPRPPPLKLTPLPPTPPATPDKLQNPLTSISSSPSQTAWTLREPKSVRFALPLPQTHSKSKTSKTSASNIHHHRKSKTKTKKIPTKPYSASLNRLIARYYALIQSLCELELSASRSKSKAVVDNKFASKTSGILAPPPSPVSPVLDVQTVRNVQGFQPQAVKNHVRASIYKSLTSIAPVLTLPFLPSQEAEKEVRRVLKRAKRGLKVLEGCVGPGGLNLELGRGMCQVQGMDLDQDVDRELHAVGGGDGIELDRDGPNADGGGEHGSGTEEQCGAAETQTREAKGSEMEEIQEDVAMMCLGKTHGFPCAPAREDRWKFGLNHEGFSQIGA